MVVIVDTHTQNIYIYIVHILTYKHNCWYTAQTLWWLELDMLLTGGLAEAAMAATLIMTHEHTT